MYVAIIDGQDCNLNFPVRLSTVELAYGSGVHRARNHTSVAETDCSLLGGPGKSLPGSPVTTIVR